MQDGRVEILTFKEEDVRGSEEAKYAAEMLGAPFLRRGGIDVKGDIYLLVETLTKVFVRLCDGVQRWASLGSVAVVLGLSEDEYNLVRVEDTAAAERMMELIGDAKTARTLEYVNNLLEGEGEAAVNGDVISICWSGLGQLCIIALNTPERVKYVVIRVSTGGRAWKADGAVKSLKRFLGVCGNSTEFFPQYGVVRVFRKLDKYLGVKKVV